MCTACIACFFGGLWYGGGGGRGDSVEPDQLFKQADQDHTFFLPQHSNLKINWYVHIDLMNYHYTLDDSTQSM